MRTRRLDAILRSQAVPRKFDLLSIDVEGHDDKVLASLDLNEFQPELIVIEAHGANLLSIAQHTITRRLVPFAYILMAFQGINLFFQKRTSKLPQHKPNPGRDRRRKQNPTVCILALCSVPTTTSSSKRVRRTQCRFRFFLSRDSAPQQFVLGSP